MPAMHFIVRWPDATETACYSPSLIIEDFLEPGESYAIDDFMRRMREALNIASERVRVKFGFACSRAIDQLNELETLSAAYTGADAQVKVVCFSAAP
jgi:uncharacterized repeat protein (TIGR04042 family)